MNVARQALAAFPADHPEYAGFLTNLCAALQTRFGYQRDRRDLTEAVSVARQAVGLLPPDHPDRIGYQSNLALALRIDAGAEALDEAIDLADEVVRATPHDHPDRAGYLANLAVAYESRFRLTASAHDAREAIAAWLRASQITSAPAQIRLHAARDAAELASRLDGPAAGLPYYETAVSLVPALALLGSGRLDALSLLEEVPSLGRDAAASAMAAGDAGAALMLLEQARGLLWRQLLDLRGDLAALREVAPELAAELVACRSVLDPSMAV